MLPKTLLAAALLLAAPLALVPTASADTCASVILEEIVCTPVWAFYCALYGVEFPNGIKNPVVNDVPGCLVRVVVHCVDFCAAELISTELP